MSYDVYLEGPEERRPCTCECGHQHERTAAKTLFSENHTSNTSGMWWVNDVNLLSAAHGKPARELDDALSPIVADIAAYPEKYKGFEPDNKWGTVESTLAFLRNIRDACRANPDATVRISS